MRRSFHKAHPAAGSRPGTLVIPPGSPPPRISVMRYSAESIEEWSLAGPDELPREFPEGTVTWVDVQGYGDEAAVRAIGAHFELSPLALEDAINAPQRPKSEIYSGYHLVISRVPIVDGQHLRMPQVCFVVGERVLVSFQERPLGLFDPVRERLRLRVGPMRRAGSDYLCYALIDTMVDRYYPVVEALSNELDDIEDSLLEDAESDVLARLRTVRRRLVLVRRIGAPQREMVASLQRDPSQWVSPQVREYLRDTQDHISQIVELIEASREMATALADELLSLVGQKTNEIMKVLTLMASIFIPLTFIAGIYGMNFENMPELHEPRGYFFVLAVMAVVAGGMLWYFYRRGWMGRPPRSRSDAAT
ncbi:MAG: magnesium/cobalt transporter CorA [Vicinamibacterales bacterium]